MGEEKGKITDAANAVKGALEAVPIYQDVVQPSAQEVGRALQGAVHTALMPLFAVIWGVDKISEFVLTRVTEKLKDVPEERIKTPNLQVAGPALEALRFAANEEQLRELYASLLATAIDSATGNMAHPSFVDIIKGMTADEARIMRAFSKSLTSAGFPVIDLCAVKSEGIFRIVARNFSLIGYQAECQYPMLTPRALDNLCRFGLLEIPSGSSIADPQAYVQLEKSTDIQPSVRMIEASKEWKVEFDHKLVHLTELGDEFCWACIREHSEYRIRAFVL
jgi:hypothetical protein